ncbi:MAG: ABC transporter ATP-binding protein [Clostridia bacterium]|nr:ABC transporter ATP-binding protein [Clostridia bacterium]
MKKAKPDRRAIKALLKIGKGEKTRGRILVFFLAAAVATLVSPVLSYLSKLIVDMLSDTYISGSTEHSTALFAVAIAIMVLAILSFAFHKVKEMEMIYINHETTKRINTYIYDKLSRIRCEYYEDAKTYDTITRVSANCPGIYSILNSLITLAMAVVSTVSYGLLLGSIRWYFILLILFPNALYVWLESKNLFDRYFMEIGQTKDKRRLNYMHTLFRDKKTNKEIRAFGLSDFLIAKYEALRIKLHKQGTRLLMKQSILSFCLVVLSKIGLFACLFIVCVNCMQGTASVGDITLVISAGAAFAASFGNIFAQVNSITGKAVYSNDFAAFEAMKCEESDKADMPLFETLRFRDVSYRYPNAKELALEGVSCEIKKGMTVALVGENGSGKTTFTKLMLGALHPSEGEIAVNGELLSALLHGFRQRISYIPQSYGTFKMTLEDNLRLGKNDIDLEQYEPRFINFHDKLPEGYATPLGNVYTGGVDLSGGEWQRISIERALIRNGSEIYVMDEPAASLDPLMESELYEYFMKILKGKTLVITSHRLGACSLADHIFVFDQGKIVEQGSHDSLMKMRGKYYEMYTAQRSLYERKAAS